LYTTIWDRKYDTRFTINNLSDAWESVPGNMYFLGMLIRLGISQRMRRLV
jgi:hypothetical protein